MEETVWTPQIVEELLFRQFIKNEDISQLLPPPPKFSNENFLEQYDQATKMLFSYVRSGPTTALSPQNVNTAAGKHYHMTPSKPFMGSRTPTPKPAMEVQRIHAQMPIVDLGSTPYAPKVASSPTPPQHKRAKVEWPASVPTNNMLKSNSRSKVAPLTVKRVAAQQSVDPDLIFNQNTEELPLSIIFAQYPKALKSISAVRNASGDWRADTFTQEEEQLYKRELGFEFLGPSQCSYKKSVLTKR
ncbi:unnamed protein product [Phytomonas sp. EM1]|nr:unnamed protein product [Phytomonas sp. EM1]|eukprot:CCW61503.1 unnamed protein product [Phytomonas sp. isolate EM1]